MEKKIPNICGRHMWMVTSFFPSFTTTDDDPRHPRSVGLCRAHKKVPTAEDDDVSSSEFGKNSRENLTSVMDELIE